MAGTPKKRERAQAAAAAAAATPAGRVGGIPDAAAARVTEAAAATAHAHTRAREARPARPATPTSASSMHGHMGPATRNAVDGQQADTIRAMAAHIKPGVRLRLWRMRPTWCSGWLEDFALERGEGLGYLLEHIRDEYGGQSYKVEVLGLGDALLSEGTLAVSGPPREHGRPIDRAKWECRDDEPVRADVAQTTRAPSPAFDMRAVVDVAKMFFDMQRAQSDSQLASVRQMVGDSRELVVAALGQREQQTQKQTFASQLGEIVEASRGIERVKKAFGAAAPTRHDDDQEQEQDETKILMREAIKGFVGSVAQGMSNKSTAAPSPSPMQPSAPVSRRGILRRQPSQRAGIIPDAAEHGHNSPKN